MDCAPGIVCGRNQERCVCLRKETVHGLWSNGQADSFARSAFPARIESVRGKLCFSSFQRSLPGALLFLVCASSAWGQGSAWPVLDVTPETGLIDPRTGEFLSYDVHWASLLVGELQIAIHGATHRGGQSCHKIEASARTKGTVERLYKSHQKFFGYLKPGFIPWVYEEWEQDKEWKLQDWVEFHPESGLARRYKKGKLRREVAVPAGAFDPVSAGFWFLSREFKAGEQFNLSVTEGKDIYDATAEVRQGPVLETILGALPTLEVIPTLYWEGKPVGDRTYRLWMSDDEKRIPVRLSVDIEYGSFSADLTEYRPPVTVN